MVRKMSSTAGPDLNWPVVRSAGRIGKPQSSVRPAAFSPSPSPVCPWHSQHLACCQTSLPRATIASDRSEEHTSELQSLMRNSYAVFCLKKKNTQQQTTTTQTQIT